VIKKPEKTIEHIISKKGYFILCDRIQDPGNVGTIIRSAAAFECSGIFFSRVVPMFLAQRWFVPPAV